jgi:hypothetical protein
LRLALLPSGNVAGAHEADRSSFCGISNVQGTLCTVHEHEAL